MKKGEFKEPSKYQIYCEVGPSKHNDLKHDEVYLHRVGAAKTLDGAKERIKEERKAMGDTFGGLIEPTSSKNRTYHVFEAVWTKVKI